MNRKHPTLRRLLAAAAAVAACAAAPAALAQDYGAMIQHEMNKMNQMLNQGQQQVNQMVQQSMQDPAVRQSYQQYLQQMQGSGRQPMDFATFTYYYIYTNGYSRDGIAHMNRVENGNRAAEMNSWRGVQQAEQNRADSMQAQRDSYYRNQQEAGRGLMGQSTYYGPNGTSTQLPHTWQNNTYHQYQGQQYYVDQSGQYYVRGGNGWWYPINR
ncbi:MAG: hypothetical protein U1E89_10655 [Burkholderiaceae bacterium]